MASYLITGTSQGLGLGLVEVLNEMPEGTVKHIFATTRSSQPNEALSALIAKSNGRAQHVVMDLDSTESIRAAASTVAAALAGAGLDYLVLNAALRDPDPVSPEDMDFLRPALSTNVVGTHEAAVAFLPLLRRGAAKTMVFFSSTLGCITTAQTDELLMSVPFPAYKISKAATHMVMALWSNRLRAEGFCVYLQSPGNLKTRVAGWDRADLPVMVGAREVVRVMQEAKPQDTGRHRNIYVKGWEKGGGMGGRYDGEDLPW
ncbi:hypothetical protein F5Y15DRAFT_191722 [Xylariaceae sp. FL0016]|nr:hypothetical protein F5Y15DRAFT_191722 [Xylariaceae sp. FL0016]